MCVCETVCVRARVLFKRNCPFSDLCCIAEFSPLLAFCLDGEVEAQVEVYLLEAYYLFLS